MQIANCIYILFYRNKWYFSPQIICVNNYKADIPPKSSLINICLSYSFLQVSFNSLNLVERNKMLIQC